MNNKSLILVAGATGTQGGAVVDALLAKGVAVRAIVRDKSSETSKALIAKNVELVESDFDNLESLTLAAKGATGVFSMQLPSSPDQPGQETQHAKNLVAASKAAGIQQIVHTSVARAGEHENFVDWEKGLWMPAYWEEKAAAINAVKDAGFAYWTIIKPPLIMENILPSKGAYMFPTLPQGKMLTPVSPETKLDWVSPQDIGRAAAEAFTHPEKFNKKEFALVGDKVTIAELAGVLSSVTGKKFESEYITVEQAAEIGLSGGMIDAFIWMNEEGYQVDPQEAADLELRPESLKSYLERNKNAF